MTNDPQQEQQNCPAACPYGMVPPQKDRGSRVLLWILIGLCAAFLIGFGGFGIYTTVTQSLKNDKTEQQSGGTSSQLPSLEEGENLPGAPKPSYSGLSLAGASSEKYASKELFERVSPSIVSIRRTDGKSGEVLYHGSGIVLTKDGYLLTTAAVVGNSRTAYLTVSASDGKRYEGRVVGYDSGSDTVVVKIDAKNLRPTEFAKQSTVATGETVTTITGASQDTYCAVMSCGILSAANREITYGSVSGLTYYQTDISYQDGDAGGALVNESGQIVGLCVGGEIESFGNYAVPVEQVRSIVTDLVQKGYRSGKVRLGISGIGLTAAEAKSYGVVQGVVIVSLADDSAFATTEVAVGDIIIKLDNKNVGGMSDVTAILRGHKAGDKIPVTVYRPEDEGEGHEVTVEIVLLEDKGQV